MNRKTAVFISILVFGSLVYMANSAEVSRIWTSKKGTKVKALLVRDEGPAVVLRTSSGKVVKVKRSSLSQKDQSYLAARTRSIAGKSSDASADWPGWLGADRNGKSRDTGLLKKWPANGPTMLWKASGIGKGYSGVAVANGLVYVTGGVGGQLKVSAFDMKGKLKWAVAHSEAWDKSYPGARATTEIDNGKLYLMSGKGKLKCLDAKTGGDVWSREMKEFGGRPGGWGYAESVLIVKDVLYVSPGSRTCMAALDKKTGSTKWESTAYEGSAQYSSAIYAVHDGVPMIVAANRSGIFSLNPSNGKLFWSNNFCAGNTANCPTPMYGNGRVFWSNGYGKGGICFKLRSSGGKVSATEDWRTRDLIAQHGGYIIHKGYIYGNHNNGWSCLELKSGNEMWSNRGVGKGSLCFADGMLYTYSEKGGRIGLVEAKPDGFQMNGEFSVDGSDQSWAHPVVTGGRLYLRYADNLYCYAVKAR